MTYTPKHPSLQDRMEALRTRTADRPAHAKLLADMEATIVTAGDPDVAADAIVELTEELPRGVSRQVAEALEDDLTWIIYRDAGMDGSVARDAYAELRVRQARAASKRAETMDSLEHMLRLPGRSS